ncbi:MAG: hypothetical protein DMG62_18365 [Acidobacteria bacterium]|nr:MAG: hypothetical protein DMG62_18365 [Acidobacteriota bacterium]
MRGLPPENLNRGFPTLDTNSLSARKITKLAIRKVWLLESSTTRSFDQKGKPELRDYFLQMTHSDDQAIIHS